MIGSEAKWADEMAAAAEAIRRLEGIWRDAVGKVGRRIEVTVGAMIFYFSGSGSMEQWSGRISRGLLHAFAENAPRAESKSHEIPRAAAARELLASPPPSGAELRRLWRERYGVFSFVTREENNRRKWTGDRDFITPADANRAAGIELVAVTREELGRARAGNLELIRELLARRTKYWHPPIR